MSGDTFDFCAVRRARVLEDCIEVLREAAPELVRAYTLDQPRYSFLEGGGVMVNPDELLALAQLAQQGRRALAAS
jgi:hypothetical protein